MPVDPDLRWRLTIRREARVMTQRDLAARMDASLATVWQLEKGLSDPRLSTLHRWAEAVGMRLVLTVETAPAEGEAAA